jgi:hypothetical protein
MDKRKEKKKSPGAPTIYGKKMRPTALYMPDYMLEWLYSKPGTISSTVRAIVQREIDRDASHPTQ